MKQNKIVVRGSTLGDVRHFCGRTPSFTFIGKTIELNDEPVCMAGVYIKPDEIVAFSHFKERINVPVMMKFRYSQMLVRFIKSMNLPVVAYADKERDTARFLTMLGFKNTFKNKRKFSL